MQRTTIQRSRSNKTECYPGPWRLILKDLNGNVWNYKIQGKYIAVQIRPKGSKYVTSGRSFIPGRGTTISIFCKDIHPIRLQQSNKGEFNKRVKSSTKTNRYPKK